MSGKYDYKDITVLIEDQIDEAVKDGFIVFRRDEICVGFGKHVIDDCDWDVRFINRIFDIYDRRRGLTDSEISDRYQRNIEEVIKESRNIREVVYKVVFEDGKPKLIRDNVVDLKEFKDE